MNGIREWSSVICLAALAAARLQYLMPDGSMERVARLVMSAFLLCSILIPFSRLVSKFPSDFSFPQVQAQADDAFQNTVDTQISRAAEQGIENIVAGELLKLDVKYKNVAVMMDTNEDGSISITKVVVSLDRKDSGRSEQVKACLEKVLGLKTEVTVHAGS